MSNWENIHSFIYSESEAWTNEGGTGMQIKGYKGGRTYKTSYKPWDVGIEGKRDFKLPHVSGLVD